MEFSVEIENDTRMMFITVGLASLLSWLYRLGKIIDAKVTELRIQDTVAVIRPPHVGHLHCDETLQTMLRR